MSMYNLMFGKNPRASLLLAVVGLREVDVERFRDVHVDNDGREIAVYTRTGGGNRTDYPQLLLLSNPLFVRTEDDEFDSTYATFFFRVPDGMDADVRALEDVLEHGIRQEFARHLARTLKRAPTDADLEREAYDAEARALSNVPHVKANGHTFVPYTDGAMDTALRLAELNNGELRTAWGILPLTLAVKRNDVRFPQARQESWREMDRVRIDYEWTIDAEYWERCKQRYADEYPKAMAKIAESVAQHKVAS